MITKIGRRDFLVVAVFLDFLIFGVVFLAADFEARPNGLETFKTQRTKRPSMINTTRINCQVWRRFNLASENKKRRLVRAWMKRRMIGNNMEIF